MFHFRGYHWRAWHFAQGQLGGEAGGGAPVVERVPIVRMLSVGRLMSR
jgi:hypothetical protein